MKTLVDKFMKGFANMSVLLCLLMGIAFTVIFLEKLYTLHLYRSGVVLIPSIVGMVTFYGFAIMIPIIGKRQYRRMKEEENSDEEDN